MPHAGVNYTRLESEIQKPEF